MIPIYLYTYMIWYLISSNWQILATKLKIYFHQRCIVIYGSGSVNKSEFFGKYSEHLTYATEPTFMLPYVGMFWNENWKRWDRFHITNWSN